LNEKYEKLTISKFKITKIIKKTVDLNKKLCKNIFNNEIFNTLIIY